MAGSGGPCDADAAHSNALESHTHALVLRRGCAQADPALACLLIGVVERLVVESCRGLSKKDR